MAEFDTITKHLIQTYPADFARFALQSNDIEDVKLIETELPTVRRADSLLRVRIGGEYALVHHEFQTADHPTMPLRMTGYIGRIIEHYGLPVHAHVFYLRPDAGRRDPGYYLQEHSGYRILVQYRVIRMSQLPGQAVLDSGSVGLLPFAPLMQPPAGQAEGAWLEQCVARAAGLPLDQSAKADVLAGLAILSGLVYNPQTITAIVSKEYLMDLMRESSFVQYLAEIIREEIREEITEQVTKEVTEQVTEQVTGQVTEQGIEQGIRESIQEALALRFQPEDMHLLASRIGAIDDVQRLKQLHRAAIQIPTLAAFRGLLDTDE